MQDNKKTPAGRAERMALIARHFGTTAFDTVRAHIYAQVPGSKTIRYADDDIVDAFAALWTAERIVRGEAVTLPPVRPQGLRMEIAY